MDKVCELIIYGIKKNLKNPKFYMILIFILIIICLIFPYIDANLFYYSRVENRIDILQKITEVDTEKLSDDKILQQEYESILSEISNQKDKDINNILAFETKKNDSVKLWKMFAGGFLCWLLALCVPFMNTFKDRKSKIGAFALLILLGLILGYIGISIPTFRNHLINYIGFPIIQLMSIVILAITSDNKN